jgi:protein TonB
MNIIKIVAVGLFMLFSFSLFAQGNDTTIYRNPDTLARFNGNIIEFLNQQLNYPTIAQSAGIEARPIVSFVVEKNGTLSNIYLSRPMGWGFDEETLWLTSTMPKWVPASHKGNIVRSEIDLQIYFALSDALDGYIVDDSIYTFSDDMPAMINENVNDYIKRELVYPREEKRDSIEGVVVIQFIVNNKGFIYDPQIIKSATPNFDKAALKMINKMPYWKPATINGRPIKLRYTLPIRFKLN